MFHIIEILNPFIGLAFFYAVINYVPYVFDDLNFIIIISIYRCPLLAYCYVYTKPTNWLQKTLRHFVIDLIRPETNRDSLAHVLPRSASATCI